MSYENAPATKLLATRCAVCGRKLVDAKSVEGVMGPDCAEKYGYNVEVPEEARREANKLVASVANNPKAVDLPAVCARLSALGFSVLSAKLIGKLAKVVVTEKAGMFAVKTPYNAEVVEAMRRIPGRRWVAEEKLNYFPVSQKAALFDLLKAHFNGETAVGPKGVFVIGAVAAPLASEPQPAMPLYKDMTPEQQARIDASEDAREAYKSNFVDDVPEASREELEAEMEAERRMEERYVNEQGEFDCSKLNEEEEDALAHYKRTGLPTFTDLTNHSAIERKSDKYRR